MPRHRSSVPLPYFEPERFYDDVQAYGHGRGTTGGPPMQGRVRGGRPAIEKIEGPVSTNDQGVHKARGPWMHTGNYIPLADPMRWTDAGPIRPEMHFWTFSWRRGTGQYGRAMEGLHTMLPRPTKYKQADEQKRVTNRTIMTRPYQNRLTVNRYRGQSFSSLTTILGGGGDSG